MYCSIPSFHQKYMNMICCWMEFQCEGGGVHEVSDTMGGEGKFSGMVLVKTINIFILVLGQISRVCIPEKFFADMSSCCSFWVCISTMHTRGALGCCLRIVVRNIVRSFEKDFQQVFSAVVGLLSCFVSLLI